MKWGMQAFDTFKVVPPGHRHRAPGEPRVPGARRVPEGRRLLSRHAGRHRLPHHDDQRHRRRRLGRGRHRGRGRHARPAGVLPHARRGRREPHRRSCAKASPRPTSCSPSPRCCARPRWSASSSSSSAKAPRRSPCRTARPSPTWRPSTARPWASSRSTTKTIEYFRGTGRTAEEIDAFEAYFKAQGLFGVPRKGDIDYTPGARARPVDASRPSRRRARSARRTASSSAS